MAQTCCIITYNDYKKCVPIARRYDEACLTAHSQAGDLLIYDDLLRYFFISPLKIKYSHHPESSRLLIKLFEVRQKILF